MDSNINIRLMLARLVPSVIKAGLGAMLIFSATAGAVPPNDPNGVPQQLEAIRAALADIQARMDGMQVSIGQNNTSLTELATQMLERTDSALSSSGEIYESVNSVEVKNELCFDTRLVKSLDLGGHAALGLGWSDVLELKAIGQVDAVGNFSLGLGHIVCIEVPLYSVYKPELELLGDEGESLHSLISSSAFGAQVSLSSMEFVYNQVQPVAEGAAEVFDTVDVALNSSDPEDRKKLLNVETYTPMMPPIVTTMIEVAPAVALDLYLDACKHIAGHPLMADVDPTYYDWMCLMNPQAQILALQALEDAVNVVRGAVKGLRDLFCAISPTC